MTATYLYLTYDRQNETLAFAARELDAYWGRMLPGTDARPPLRLAVQPDLSQYGLPAVCSPELDDQYWIDVRAGGGVILGTNARSVLLGVYRLLEEAGCRFLRPGGEYEVVPQVTPAALCRTLGGTASLRHRGSCIEGANSLENITDFIGWLPKIGCNSFFLQFKIPFTFLDMWYSHKNNGRIAPEPFGWETAEEMSREIDAQVALRGMLYHRVGHGWTSEALGCPDGGWMVSREPLSDEARAMIALVDGKRELFGGVPLNTNLCYSDENVIRRVAGNVARYAEEHGEASYLHVWLADECNNTCECRRCLRSTPADLYIRLLNAVDDALRAKGLPTKIAFLMYHELLWAPKTERLRNPGRFALMFAPISRTFEKSYREADTLPIPPEYQRNRISPPKSLEENMSFLRPWRESFGGDAFVYDYHLGRAHYGDMGYVAIARLLHRDITGIGDLGLDGYIACQELRCFLPNGLPNYVMGKAAFDTTRSFEGIAEEYFSAAYGSAWREAYSYLDTLSGLCSPDYFNGAGPRVSPAMAARFGEAAALAQAAGPMIERGLHSGGDGVCRRFFDHLRYHRQYVLRLARALESLAEGETGKAGAGWGRFTGFIQSGEARYQKALDVFRMIEVATKYTGFRQADGPDTGRKE